MYYSYEYLLWAPDVRTCLSKVLSNIKYNVSIYVHQRAAPQGFLYLSYELIDIYIYF